MEKSWNNCLYSLILKEQWLSKEDRMKKKQINKEEHKKSIIVEYTQETKKEFKINMLQKNSIKRHLKF